MKESENNKMRMNTFEGKKILSLIRDGDYAHAGEEEAISLVFRDIPRLPERYILDAGCGRGGTSKYIQDHKWGTVSGFDIDSESVEYAKQTYSGIDFFNCDVVNIDKVIDKEFDLICLFNAYYSFPDKPKALKALASVTKESSQIIIFDYTVFPGNKEIDIDFRLSGSPIDLIEIEKTLKITGWDLQNIEEINKEYATWYEEFLGQIDQKRNLVVDHFGVEKFNLVRQKYASILEAINRGILGGAIIKAHRVQ